MRLLLAIVLMGMSSVALADETVSVKVGYQTSAVSGQFGGTVQGQAVGTRIDTQKDLTFNHSDNITAEAALQFGNWRLQAGYLPLDFKGSGTLTRDVTFNGQTYVASTQVTSQVKEDIFDLAATYYLINMNDMPSRFQLGIQAAVALINLDTSLSAVGKTENKLNVTVPIPAIGLRARVALADFLGIVGRVDYAAYSSDHFLNADAQVEFSPVPLLGIYAGYRTINQKLENSGVFLDTTMAGPYIGVFARF
jgi:hypothetical protein